MARKKKQEGPKIIDCDIHDLKFYLFDPSDVRIYGVQDDYIYFIKDFMLQGSNENEMESYKFLLKMRITKYNYFLNTWIEEKRDIYNFTGHFCGDFGFFYTDTIKVHESKLKLEWEGEERYIELPVVECEFDDDIQFDGICGMEDEDFDEFDEED